MENLTKNHFNSKMLKAAALETIYATQKQSDYTCIPMVHSLIEIVQQELGFTVAFSVPSICWIQLYLFWWRNVSF
jgi:hypothetical protein